MIRKDTRRKCVQTVFVEIECERGEERGDDNGNGKRTEVSEGRESSEDGRGKIRKTVGIKVWRKGWMKESEMEKSGMKKSERG